MNLFDIEARLFALADKLREQNEAAARQVLTAITDIRAWHQQERSEWYARQQNLLQKWSEFSNGAVEEAQQRQHELIEQECARILRVLAVDPRWQGSYADLVKLTAKGGDHA